MTTTVDIVNRALQTIGTQTTVASLSENSNEAIQANLILTALREQLTRMAPWNCATIYDNLYYITSLPGTPENTSTATSQWQRGQPEPPWVYEYFYPINCARPLFIVPTFQNDVGAVPIYPQGIVVGQAYAGNFAPVVKFRVALDFFYSISAVTIAAAGLGYAVGDTIRLAYNAAGALPIGLPASLTVSTVNGTGGITAASVTSNVPNANPAKGGSYFYKPANPIGIDSTSGSGTGATFNATWNAQSDQRVILTNVRNPTLCMLKYVTDPDVMDPLFLDAWVKILGARLAISLTGDKTLANMKIEESNTAIIEARKADGNEGLTINDSTPDWIRGRGALFNYLTPNTGFDWGPLWPLV